MTREQFAAWMYERGSAKMIKRDGRDYLERLYLLALRSRPGTQRPGVSHPRADRRRLRSFKVFDHLFHMDDPDPLHDHPWDWGRVIVNGAYREHYIDGTSKVFEAGHVLWHRQAEVFHRVELLTPTVHTIFWHWQRRRTWGFMLPDGWAATPEEGQDGREMTGVFLPRKLGPVPGEVKL